MTLHGGGGKEGGVDAFAKGCSTVHVLFQLIAFGIMMVGPSE